MKHLYFCRHGLSQLNKDGKWAGTTDTPLTDEGITGAKLAGQAARYLHIDYIVSSPLSRAYDTARIIAEEISFSPKNIVLEELAIERHFGDIEGTTWSPDRNINDVPSAETTDALLQRARLVYEKLQAIAADNILIVSHGSFGRALRHVITPSIPFDGSEQFQNSTIVTLL